MRRAHHGLAGVAAAASCVLAPLPATAQEAPRADPCTVRVVSGVLAAGVSVVEVTARLSRPVGRVTGLDVAEESGIGLSSRYRLEWLFAASRSEGGEAPRPIEMAIGSKRATLWLNLLSATPGTHRIVLNGERGSCTGILTVR